MTRHIKYIFLIVVSVMLTTISSCSSRKMNKNISEETSADKRNSVVKSDSSVITNKGISSFKATNLDKYELTNNLDIEYEPTFDQNGNLIPFSYSRDDNGNVTKVNITGNAKVKDTSTKEIIKEQSEEKIDYKEQLESLVKYVNTLESEVTILKQKESKEVKVAPDYFKYILWLGIAILLLSGIIIFCIIYFRNTIGKYKKILNTFTNNDT